MVPWKCEVTNIDAIFDILRLVQCQYVQRSVALQQLFNVIFQQRTDHNTRAILLNLA